MLPFFQQHNRQLYKKKKRDNSTHGHHQMITIEIRLIIYFVAKDGEAVYSYSKIRTWS